MTADEPPPAVPASRALEIIVRNAPMLAAGFAIVTGFVAIVGWWTGTNVLPTKGGEPRMTANTALMAMLSGTSLWLATRAGLARRWRIVAGVCAAAICAIAALTLFEYVSGLRLGIDRMLTRAEDTRTHWPAGRPSPQTAIAFLLLASGVAFLLRGRKRPADTLALVALAIGVGVLLGYLFGVPLMYRVTSLVPVVGMSIPTALVMIALAWGILTARIEGGVLAVVMASDSGGVIARRLLAGLGLFPLVAIVIILGARIGWYALPIASALVLFFALAEGSAMIVSTARKLSAVDAANRAANDALRLSEERVRTVLELASEAIFVADLDGRYIEVNEAACRLLGYRREELLGKTIRDLIPPGEEARLEHERAQVVAGATEINEWDLRRRDGSYVPVEVSAKVLPDARWLAIVRDCTDRRVAEEANARAAGAERAARAELEAISRASATVSGALAELREAGLDHVLRVIAEQARVLTSAEYTAIGIGDDPTKPFEHWAPVGMSAETMAAIGRHPRPTDLLGVASRSDHPVRLADVSEHPDSAGVPAHHPDITSLLAVPIRRGERAIGTLFLANKRGGEEFTEQDARQVMLLGDRVAGAIELGRAWAAETIERARLQSIIDQLPQGVLLLDANARLTLFNDAMITITGGLERPGRIGDELPRFDLRDREGQRLTADELPGVRALRHGEVTRDREYLMGHADGHLMPVAVSAVPIRNPDGQVTGAVAVFADISERKEAERLRDEWTAVVAHDLRQPLNTILLLTDQLLLLLEGTPTPKAVESVDRIRTASWRLNRMIEDLLDAARIASSRLVIEPRAADLVELLRGVVETTLLASPGASIHLDTAAHQLAWIDPDRIHQVVSNLLSNAVKYGTPGAEIRVTLTTQNSANHVMVTNQGDTLTAEDRRMLFSRFARTRAAKEARTPGIGLGLYICKGIVEAHGGRIWIESEAGTTTFHVILPALPTVA